MALVRRSDEVKIVFFYLGLALLCYGAKGARRGCADRGPTVFDVTKYGAVGKGETNSALAFIQAWNAACQSTGAAKVLIPKGTFLAGEVFFYGPCNSSKPITVEVQGTILAETDLSEYPNGLWFEVRDLDGLVIMGGGTFNGQGETAWKYNSCGRKAVCDPHLPPSMVFTKVSNAILQGITFVNSKAVNIKITDSNNLTLQNLNITAPPNSPNTDGIYITRSDLVTIKSCTIGTGDDCISQGEGATRISFSDVKCTPGRGARY